MSLERRLKKAQRFTNQSDTPIHQHMASVFRVYFSRFNWRRDMWIGALFETSAILLQWWFELLSDPIWIALTYILPIVSLLIADVLWRTCRALKRLYKERPHTGFREPVDVGMVLTAGWCFVGLLCWYVTYLSSPHFHIEIRNTSFLGGEESTFAAYIISHNVEAPQPNTQITFPGVFVSNSGVPSPAMNWKLVVQIGNEYLVGQQYRHDSVAVDPQDPNTILFHIRALDMIFGYSGAIQKEHIGIADFIILGVSEDSVRQPGTKLILSCEDSTGRVYKTTEVVTAKEKLLIKPLS